MLCKFLCFHGRLAEPDPREIFTRTKCNGVNDQNHAVAGSDLSHFEGIVAFRSYGTRTKGVAARCLVSQPGIAIVMAEIPKAIRQTLEGVDRMANIVRAMKKFSHPVVLEMVLTDLSKSIANTLMVARNEWQYIAEVKTEFDPNLPLAPCLPGELNQVLLKMIVNAGEIGQAIAGVLLDAGQSVTQNGEIHIKTPVTNSNVVVVIEDNGSGISSENLERIFEPFFYHQTHWTRGWTWPTNRLRHFRKTQRIDQCRERARQRHLCDHATAAAKPNQTATCQTR